MMITTLEWPIHCQKLEDMGSILFSLFEPNQGCSIGFLVIGDLNSGRNG
jgi:hypothetical protein